MILTVGTARSFTHIPPAAAFAGSPSLSPNLSAPLSAPLERTSNELVTNEHRTNMLGDAYEFLGSCKRNVAVGRTTFKNKSGERLNMLGAFSTAGFAHGDFIGFYSLCSFESPRSTSVRSMCMFVAVGPNGLCA